MWETLKNEKGTRFGYPELTITEITDFFVTAIVDPSVSFIFIEFITGESFCHKELTNCENLYTFLIGADIRFLVHSMLAGTDVN
jgi:hypothetical protein